ncbi:MAG: SDR family oxidoreductase [Bdellovibrionaceae bacterium]|nr:SDR family oxidoreductase [Pseudobdellovibrionaceae bacterium]
MTFLVTGAGRGIGLEFTRQLLGTGHHVIAWVRHPEKSSGLAQLKKDFSATLTIDSADVTNEKSVSDAAQKITTLDVVINNAGVLLDADDDFESLDLDTVKQTFEVNVYGPMRVAQHTLPILEQSKSPLLINISSLMGSVTDNGTGGYYAYRMSKTAVNMFTKSFSVDHPKIKTFCMHPGWVQTDMGGPNATTTVEKSVTGLLRIILEPQKHATGSFISFEGKFLSW